MGVKVGGVEIELEGDSSGATAAIDAVTKKLADLVRQEGQLTAALADVNQRSKLSTEQQNALKEALQQTSAQIDRMSGSAKAAAPSLERLSAGSSASAASMSRVREVGARLDNAFGPLQTAISGVAQAMGGNASMAANLAGGIADIGMAMTRGGGVLAIVVAVGAAISVVVGHFGKMREAAKKAADDAAQAMRDLDQAIADVGQRMEALARGTSIDIIKQEKIVLEVQHTIDEKVALFGDQNFRGGMAASRSDPGKEFGDAALQSKFNEIKALLDVREKQQLLLGALQMELDGEVIKNAEEDLKREAERKAADAKAAAVSDAKKPKTMLSSAPYNPADASAFIAAMREGHAAAPMMLEITGDQANELAGMTKESTTTLISSIDSTDDAFMEMMDSLYGVTDELDTIDVRSSFEKVSDAIVDVIDKFTAPGAVAGAVETIASGGMQAGGAQAGGLIGGIVDVATGGATGGLGAVLGTILGGIMGKALDSLIESLEVLTPLFDAVAVIIEALQPILIVLKMLFAQIGELMISLAPIILQLAQPIAALVLLFVRIVQAIEPFVGIILVAVGAVLSVLTYITMFVGFIDQYILRPLAEGAEFLYNGFVDIVNRIIQWIRNVTGNDKWGTKLDKRSTDFDNKFDEFYVDAVDLLPPAVEEGVKDGTEAADGGGGSSAAGAEVNIPSGWKGLAGAIFDAGQGQSGPGGYDEQMDFRRVNIHIENWNSSQTISEDFKRLKAQAMRGSVASFFSGRRTADDDKG